MLVLKDNVSYFSELEGHCGVWYFLFSLRLASSEKGAGRIGQ